MKARILLVSIAIVIMSTGMVYAKGSNALGFQVKSDSDDVILTIVAETPSSGMWLGITFYPPNVKNTAKEGVVKLLPLKRGHGIYEVTLEPRLVNGSFEAAVWTKKIPADECTATETICKTLGYKLNGMRSYIWGYLVP